MLDIQRDLIPERLQRIERPILTKKVQELHPQRLPVEIRVEIEQMDLEQLVRPREGGAWPHVGDGGQRPGSKPPHPGHEIPRTAEERRRKGMLAVA